jgi:adenylate kinase/deoxycytidine triphosphate deaminase
MSMRAEPRQHVVCVFGVSGVGKSHLVRSLVAEMRGWVQVTAGELLQQATKVEGNSLRTADRSKILRNQQLFAGAFASAKRQYSGTNLLVDAHSVINNDQEIVRVPVETVDSIGPELLVFVCDEPENIARRRLQDTDRDRPARSAQQIAEEQRIALENCEHFAAVLNVPLLSLKPGEIGKLRNTLEGLQTEVPSRRTKNESGERRMKEGPWDDWIPGVLSPPQMEKLVELGMLGEEPDAKIGYSSIDLTVAEDVYELPEGSVKPFGDGYLNNLQRAGLVKKLSLSTNGAYVFKARQSYLCKLKERIPYLSGTPIYGQATAKSSVGRMDVLARLVVDGMFEYESFDPTRIRSGDMFLEITPMTFDVCIKPGSRLTQLRLFKGDPQESRISGEHLYNTVLFAEDGETSDTLSVDLRPVPIAGHEVAAFSASRSDGGPALPMWSLDAKDLPKAWEYWHFRKADDRKRLQIRKNEFYIIRSYERIRLPAGVAVYCRASDESIGEMRIHYAGFVHPFFGLERDDAQKGTPLIFEVRGHDVDVSLRHRERMARLEFYRMSEDCDRDASKDDNAYGSQSLRLSKYFSSWPEKASLDASGRLTPTG